MAEKAIEWMDRSSRIALAAIGFLGGYLWGVWKWAGVQGLDIEPLFSAVSLGATVATLVYAASLVALFGPSLLRRSQANGIAPVAFFLSFLIGTGGIRAALWVVG